jgi:hypothetical protein
MRKLLLSVLIWMIYIAAFSKEAEEYLKFFPDSIVQIAKDIKNLKIYSPQEKEVFLWTNLSRMAPKEFALMLDDYISTSELYKKNNPYVISLKKDLLKASPILLPFKTHPTLKKVALSHAEYGKRTGQYGHQNIQKRYMLVNKEMKHLTYAENCGYHDENALDAFISLLIDEGIRDVGHRKNILDPDLTHMGVAILPLKSINDLILIQSFSAK